MNSMLYIIWITSLFHLYSSQASVINPHSTIISSIPRDQYPSPFITYSYQHPLDEFGRRIHSLRSGIFNVIRLIDPLSYFTNDQKNNSKISSENWNQINPQKHSINLIPNLNENYNEVKQNKDTLKIETNSPSVLHYNKNTLGMGRVRNQKQLFLNNDENENSSNSTPFQKELKTNFDSQSTESVQPNINKDYQSDSLLALNQIVPYQLKKTQRKIVDSPSPGTPEENIPNNNYNTDIAHNYKSLAAFNLNVAPFLTRRTRSVDYGSVLRTLTPIISPYLSSKASTENTGQSDLRALNTGTLNYHPDRRFNPYFYNSDRTMNPNFHPDRTMDPNFHYDRSFNSDGRYLPNYHPDERYFSNYHPDERYLPNYHPDGRYLSNFDHDRSFDRHY